MKTTLSRRDILKAAFVSGAETVLFASAGVMRALAAEEEDHFCLTLCNHWSYTGIGWQAGLESDVLSVTDAMEIVDLKPHIKTCINLDARAFELMAENSPKWPIA